jgi:polar amino acid transport system substrate-binding protein
MLMEHRFDAGFPWVKPNCDDNPERFRCRHFHFSEPLTEVLVQLFVPRGADVAFDQDSDIHGQTLCRPEAYYTHDLDRPGRRWLRDDRIELVRAVTPDACFDKLLSGDVDAITVNEFLGRRIIDRRNLGDEVKAMQRPVSVQSLHLVVPRTNPRARALLYRFNAGLRRLKNDDRYRDIVERQVWGHWSRL